MESLHPKGITRAPGGLAALCIKDHKRRLAAALTVFEHFLRKFDFAVKPRFDMWVVVVTQVIGGEVNACCLWRCDDLPPVANACLQRLFDFALGISAGNIAPLVKLFFAACHAELNFGFAAFEIEFEGN